MADVTLEGTVAIASNQSLAKLTQKTQIHSPFEYSANHKVDNKIILNYYGHHIYTRCSISDCVDFVTPGDRLSEGTGDTMT